MELHQWTELDLGSHLVGDAALLRETYFGDLILSAPKIQDLRARSIASVKDRWMPGAHVSVDAEGTIRKVLGELDYWSEITEQVASLGAARAKLTELTDSIEERLRSRIDDLNADLEDMLTRFDFMATAYTDGKMSEAIQGFAAAWTPRVTLSAGRDLARELRRMRSAASLDVHIALAYHRDAVGSFCDLRDLLSTKLIAVVGPAGSGKTHLAAELSSGRNSLLCGLYVEASRLARNDTLGDLFRSQIDRPLEEILEAVEAAGVRAGVRVPIIIDGLNESENPLLWSRELAMLQVVLRRFQHVVVIVTTRPQVADDILPEDCMQLELDGFAEFTSDAVKKYFEHYRIDSASVRFPVYLFRNPLLLRIFCEATNPDRLHWVSPEVVPESLLSMFSRFRRTAVERIVKQDSQIRRYDQDILNAIDNCAIWMWDHKSRFIPFGEFRSLLSDEGSDWDSSLTRVLRDEGIVTFLNSEDERDRVAFLYDGFAGFLIADALIRVIGKSSFVRWIEKPTTLRSLGCRNENILGRIQRGIVRSIGRLPEGVQRQVWRLAPIKADRFDSHPLATDIRASLTGLIPRRLHIQFWQHLRGELREEAIVNAASLERSLLDRGTIQEIAQVAMLPTFRYGPELFDRLSELHDFVDHPLNADFASEILCRQTVAARDLRWSEWVRDSQDLIVAHLQDRIADWRSRASRIEQDRLQAVWVKWMLTSTIRDLRDQATHALYCYGRGDPGSLFQITVNSLTVNDPYLPERLLAASYGVLMAAPSQQVDISKILEDMLQELYQSLCGSDAECPTYHWLIREYTLGIVALARQYYGSSIGPWTHAPKFREGKWPEEISDNDSRNSVCEMIYGFHFSNYTIGSLVHNRRAYDFDHAEYQEVLSWMRGRVWDLGWRHIDFAQIDRQIRDGGSDYQTRSGRIEAYLKKYCWIGFFESAGRLDDMGRTPLKPGHCRLAEVDIDPSFPAVFPVDDSDFTGWLSDCPYEPQTWVTSGVVKVGDCYLRRDTLRSEHGPWVVLAGYLSQEDIESRRKVFGFVQAILTKSEFAAKLKVELEQRIYPGNRWIPSSPANYYVFAGELPWSRQARHGRSRADLAELYSGTITLKDCDEIPVEIPVHNYNWESYHSSLNKAGGHSVPATTLAEEFDLRAMPDSLDWCDPAGRLASLTVKAPHLFEEGDLLYVREDLLRKYCEKRDYKLIWIVWGEREAWFADVSTPKPAWVIDAYSDHTNIWRRVACLDELRSRREFTAE